MGWLTIIMALLPLLLKLLEWLTKQQTAGKELTDKQKRKVNEVIYRSNKIRAVAVRMGCNSVGEKPDDE